MGQKIYKAVYYERASTLHDEQNESMKNQRRLFESYCKRHPEIHLEGIYSERRSGKSDNRPEYRKMLERIFQGDIDYVMIKDFKRISRSTEISAQLKTLAKKYGFKFILLSTGQIYDPCLGENRMMYGFESLVNEEVVYRQSEYGRLAHRQKCEARKINRNNVTFGYAWDAVKQDIVVDEEKAEIIRTLFDLYVFRDYGIKELRKYLAEHGYLYTGNTVNKWLQETAYIGVFHINKKGSELGVGSGQKTKRYTNPKEEWIPVERPDLAILEKPVFNLAQKIRKSRQACYEPDKNGVHQGRFRGKHLFAAKVYCGECGCPYVHSYADRKKTVGVYVDSFSNKSKNVLEKCSNIAFRRVYEKDLERIVLASINGMIKENDDCFSLLISVIEQVIRDDRSGRKQVKTKERELKQLVSEADRILAAYIEASGILREDLEQKYEDKKAMIAKVKDDISQIQNYVQSEELIVEQVSRVKAAVAKWRIIDTLDRTLIEAIIYKIVLHKNGQVEVIMNSDDIKRYQLLQRENGNSSKGSHSSIQNKISYMYNESMYIKEVQRLMEDLLKKQRQTICVSLFSYMLNERDGEKIFEIFVEVSLGRK